MLRCLPSELENESAVKLDWLIAVDDTVAKLRKEREEESFNG
jgi:hypothetical protein